MTNLLPENSGEGLENQKGGNSVSNETNMILGNDYFKLWGSEEEFFNEYIGSIDKKKLEEQVRLFGAKSANLQVTQYLLEKMIKLIDKDIDGSNTLLYITNFLSIPRFETIPTALYRKWKNGNDIQPELEPFYNSFKDNNIILRSSAVFSEDGDETTGAGIYKSTVCNTGISFERFVDNIIDIYQSVDDEQAIEYRRLNGINDEEMGIIVQEYQYGSPSITNTIIPGVPELMDITGGNSRPIVNKEQFKESKQVRESLHYELDFSARGGAEQDIICLFSLLLEKYYGTPLQIESIHASEGAVTIDIDGSISVEYGVDVPIGGGTDVSLVQARSLPSAYIKRANIQFLDKEPVMEGSGIGIIDQKLPVLSNWEDNSKKEGVVIFAASEFVSERQAIKPVNFPKDGAVIVLGESSKGHGHIETLCIEKGLSVIYGNGNHDFNIQASPLGTKIDHLGGERELHVIINGFKGRVYNIEK